MQAAARPLDHELAALRRHRLLQLVDCEPQAAVRAEPPQPGRGREGDQQQDRAQCEEQSAQHQNVYPIEKCTRKRDSACP